MEKELLEPLRTINEEESGKGRKADLSNPRITYVKKVYKNDKIVDFIDLEGLDKKFSEKMEELIQNLEIQKELFYKKGKWFNCKDIELVKKLYERSKSYPKIEEFLRKKSFKIVPNQQTMRRIVRDSFESRDKYKIWKNDIYLTEYQDIARKKEGKCISREYKNNRTKLEFECKAGQKFKKRPDHIKEDRWCPECARVKKATLKEFQDIARDRGGEFLSEEYSNIYIPKDLFTINKNKCFCKNVDLLKEVYEVLNSYSKIEKYFKKQGCEIVPSYNTLRLFIRGSFESKEEYYVWKSNIKLKEYHKIARDKDGVCLSEEYKNSCTKLKFRCKKGHEFEMRPSSIKEDRWCPECAENKKLTLKEFQYVAKNRNGVCLSEEYINTRTKLKFRCKKGHEFEMRPDTVKEGHWCQTCSERTSERVCRGLFEAIFNKEFKKARPEWLKNSEGHQLHLDGYNEELKLAFERHGEQHYKFLNWFHKTIKEYILQLSNDQQKNELCEQHGVILIEVPYWIKYDEMQRYIIKGCQAKGVNVPEIKYKIDWEKFKWDIDDDDKVSLMDWI